MRRPLAVAHPARAIRTHHGARRLGMRRRRRTAEHLPPAPQAPAPSRNAVGRTTLAFSLRPPGHDLADNSATEGEHADHEDAAGDYRPPFAKGGEIVFQANDDEGSDDRAKDRTHATEQRHEHH